MLLVFRPMQNSRNIDCMKIEFGVNEVLHNKIRVIY